MFAAALLAACLLALHRNKRMLAALLLFALVLSRPESALILAAVVVGFAARRREWTWASGVLGAALTGVLVGEYVTRNAASNVHGMPELAYLFLKLPVNLPTNLLGIQFWTNSARWCDDPVLTLSLSPLQLGSIDQVGFCAPDASFPLRTLAALLTTFGVLPVALLYVGRSSGWRSMLNQSTLSVVLVFGVVMFLLGPAAGKSVDRLIAFGWPAFTIALPLLWVRTFQGSPPLGFWLLHFTVTWLPWVFITHFGVSETPAYSLSLVLAVAGYYEAWRLLQGSQTPSRQKIAR